MKSIKFIFDSILFGILIQFIECNILVKTNTNKTLELFHDLPAEFGPELPLNGINVYALPALPIDGCEPQPPSPSVHDTSLIPKKYVLVVARNNCSFEKKVRNAQIAKYDAVIVFNIGSDNLEHMSSKNDASDIEIPSVFIGETSGRYIMEAYLWDNTFTFYLVIDDELPFNINLNLILPFSILMGFCFLSMILYVIYKCILEQRRLRQNRLPKKLLKKIPIVKFVEGHPYDTCVICLEDYTKGERLRVLPCAHAYHCHCIDTWLTKNRRNCPICKRKVFVRKSRSGVPQTGSNTTSDSDDDTQPLLNTFDHSAGNHGTFMNTHRIRDLDEENTDDENILVGRYETGSRTRLTQARSNPFDRLPPLNQQQNDGNSRRSIWNLPIFRLFTRRSQSAPILNDLANSLLTPTINSNEIRVAIAVPRATSNNILNSNLSGSFHDNEDNEQFYDTHSIPGSSSMVEIPDRHNRNNSGRAAVTTSSSLTRNQNQLDAFVQTPSQGAIGVAALPNTNFQQGGRKIGQRSTFNI